MRLALLLSVACALPLAAQVKADTIRNAKPKPPTYAKDSTHKTDSISVEKLALKQVPTPDSARVSTLVIRGDSAAVIVIQRGTVGGRPHVEAYRVTLQRRAGQWRVIRSELGATS